MRISKKIKEEETPHNNGELIHLSIESKIPLSPSTMLFVFDEEELAKQLTLVDFRIYQAIRVLFFFLFSIYFIVYFFLQLYKNSQWNY